MQSGPKLISEMDPERHFAPDCMSRLSGNSLQTLKRDMSICFSFFGVWRRRGTLFGVDLTKKSRRELCSGLVRWRKRCSSNIDNYLLDGGRGNQNRTFEFLQPEGYKKQKVRLWCVVKHQLYVYTGMYLYIYYWLLIYTCIYWNDNYLSIHLWIYASMHLYIYASMHLRIRASAQLCIYASMHPCICASMHLCVYAAMHISIHLSIYLSTYL